ncbi:MAG: type I secretion C-terminal target domain-containing protein, partial [Betaproteobacteria bacterium]|nr:type I secretion C-terminal target domain-containing protein [Betaproteobacteria bacterium]
SGTLSFAAGQTSRTFTVQTAQDNVYEGSETMSVTLSGATNGAAIGDGTGIGTILDDDARTAPTICNVGCATAPESANDVHTSYLVHTVTLSGASTTPTTYAFGLAGGTATAGVDFGTAITFSNGVTISGSNITVPAGVTSFTVTYPTLKDHLDEHTETTLLTVGGKTGTGYITNVDTPLVLDLNGDGVHSVGLDAGVNFDVNNDGVARNVGWVSAQDGLLVRDINGDGQINNGSELFGSGTSDGQGGKTRDGFQALAQLDSNQDGIINSLDLGFNELQVWRDLDTDGVTDQGELVSLRSVGVQSLNLAHTVSDAAESGNLHMLLGDYTSTDGQTREMTDVFFGAGDRIAAEAVAMHGQAAAATGLTSDAEASVWKVGTEDGNLLVKGFDVQHDVLDLRDLLPGEQGGDLDGLLSIKREGSSTVIDVKDGSGNDHSIILAGVDLLGSSTDQQIIQELLNNHKIVTD